VLETIKALQDQGGVTVTVIDGVAGEGRTVTLYPVLSFVICDNKEAAALASVKAGQTARPCRFCNCKLSEMNSFLGGNVYGLRDPNTAARAINDANKEYCAEHSIHYDVKVSQIVTDFGSRVHLLLCFVWQNAFMTHPQALGPTGLMHVYECFPPDLLHTLCGGVVRYACVWSLEVIKVSRSFGLTHVIVHRWPSFNRLLRCSAAKSRFGEFIQKCSNIGMGPQQTESLI